jgi:2-iminoacetate synthase ThiH
VVDILNTQKFSLIVEKLVQEKRCSYMDAVVLYCEKNEMEIETAAKLLNTKIKQQLEIEYADLNFLPKVNTLPI